MEGGSAHIHVQSPSSFDKSRVLDVKPLRSLTPVFPSIPQASPHDFAPLSGSFPAGFNPFYPFSMPQTDIPLPNESAKSVKPVGVTLNEDRSLDSQKRAAPYLGDANVLQKQKKKKNQDVVSLQSADCRLSSSQRADGDRETVDSVLMMFDGLRRRLSQLDDAKVIGDSRRMDLKSGNVLMKKGIRTNMEKRIGTVPGIEIGDIFYFRMELCLVGLHSQSMAGIDYMFIRDSSEKGPVAISIVSSGGYDDDAEDRNVLIYSGQGGNVSKTDKQVADQKLQRGNLALERSLKKANDVRVIRGMRDSVNPLAKVYLYDGLYTVQESWIGKGKSGYDTYKYKLVRKPGQPGAFAIWETIQKWREGYTSRAGLILVDITSGAESIPVSLVNDVDEDKGPAYFTYFPTLKFSKSFTLTQPSFGCNCHSACLPGNLNCSCICNNGGDFPYTSNGVLVCQKPLVHECGPTCPCFPDCKNRVSQTGLKVHLEVFKTMDRGWGLRSLDPIRAGTFICEFAGEVIDKAKVKRDGEEGENDEYIFDSSRTYDNSFRWNYDPGLLEDGNSGDASKDSKIPPPLIISAKNVGNVARFMNHSCSPNVFWQPTLYEHNSASFLHIAFFAVKHIPPMTELTYDYGIVDFKNCDVEASNILSRRKKCLCGSTKCGGYYP